MQITKYLFGIKLKPSVSDRLTYQNLGEILRSAEGKWCKLIQKNGVGTVVFKMVGNNIYCQSLMEPKKLPSIKQTLNIGLNETFSFEVRLPVNINSDPTHSIFGGSEFTDSKDRSAVIEANLNAILSAAGMERLAFKYTELPFGSIYSYTDDGISDIAAADFSVKVKVKDLKEFKKACIYGLGDYRECGFGMICPKLSK